MATASSGQVTLSSDSDAGTDMYCEHCEKESGKIKSAAAYCEECLEFMCSVCIPYHKKFNPKHTVSENQDMPQHFCIDKCNIHAKEIVKFYCEKCNKVACLQCKEDFHRDRCILKFIPNIVKDQDFRVKRKEFQDEIEIFLNNLDDTKTKIRNNIKESSDIASETLSTIEICKEELTLDLAVQRRKICEEFEKKREILLKQLEETKLEKLQFLDKKQEIITRNIGKADETLTQEVTAIMETDHKNLTSLEGKTNSIKSKIEIFKQDKNIIQANAVKLFVAMHYTEALEKDYIEILKENDVQRYVFVKNEETINIEESEVNAYTIGNLMKSKSSKDKRSISPERTISVKDEKRKSRLVDICLLSDDRLVAADDLDISLTMIDTNEKLVLSRMELSSPPYALTKISENQVAVTFPNEHKIKFFSILRDNEIIPTGDIIGFGLAQKGIAFNPPTLHFSASDKLFFIVSNSMEFENPKIFQFGKTLFSKPNRMVFNHRLKSIYLADGKSVLNFDFAGKILHRSKNLINDVLGLALDKSDTLYVSAQGALSGKIYQLSYDLTEVTELVKGVFEAPFGLCYCSKEDKLYCGSSGKINVYHIK